MKILVTGFKPFLGEKINPSEKLAIELSKLNAVTQSLILPVEFKKSFEILEARLEQDLPEYLVMLGQASGRKNICLEKIGLNWMQSEHQDESGYTPKSGRIDSDSALALLTEFPIDETYLFLKKNNFPVEISFSAGTYVCNDLYFRTLQKFSYLNSIFVHVPLLPEQLSTNDLRPHVEYSKQFEVLSALIHFLIQK